LVDEEKFFYSNPNYAPYASRLGIPYLAKTLNIIIIKHIKKSLPHLRSKINSMLYQKEKELKLLKCCEEDPDEAGALILNIISKFVEAYRDFIEGKFVKDTSVEYMGGSRINYIFFEVFNKAILQVDPFDSLTDEDIKTAIRNASSLRPNLFIPEVAFEVLSKQQIQRLQSPSI